MNRFEKRKKAIEQSMLEHVEAYQAIYKNADSEDRDPTDEERLEVEEHHRALETLKEEREGVEANIETLKGVDDLGREIGANQPIIDARVTTDWQDNRIQAVSKSLGEIFTESDGFKKVQDAYKSGGQAAAGRVDGRGADGNDEGHPDGAHRRAVAASWRPRSRRWCRAWSTSCSNG